MPLGGMRAEEIAAALNASSGEIRREVARTVTLKFSAQLSFVLDDSFDRMSHTQEMLARPEVARDLDSGVP